MRILAKSDIGKARQINQDYFYVTDEKASPKICILADGMGGYTGGEIASSLATSAARLYIEEKFKFLDPTLENIQKVQMKI